MVEMCSQRVFPLNGRHASKKTALFTSQPVFLGSLLLALLTFNSLCTSALSQQTCTQSPQDCTSGETYFNPSTGCCEACTVCESGQIQRSACNGTVNTVCVEDCRPDVFFYSMVTERCEFVASRCPFFATLGRAGGSGNSCKCPECYLENDLYCEHGPIGCSTSTNIDSIPVSPNTNANTLPPWGIGLIAVGVVLGIVAFSACFLFVGIFSRGRNSHHNEHHSGGSDNSESGLMSSNGHTNSTFLFNSSHQGYLSSHDMLQLLRTPQGSHHSPLHNGGSISSLRSSPISTRGSPKPNRTNSNQVRTQSSSPLSSKAQVMPHHLRTSSSSVTGSKGSLEQRTTTPTLV